MLIDKIKGIGSIFNNNKSAPVKSSSQVVSKDNVDISNDAKIKAEVKNLTNSILAGSETLNAERIADIKEKLANGFYNNLSDEILNKTAEKITSSLTEKKLS